MKTSIVVQLWSFVCFVYGCMIANGGNPTGTETAMTVPQIIKENGYPVEVHTITTDDGYILTMHRIPHGKNGPGATPRQPVMVQHGMVCSSVVWVWNEPDPNLAYQLANENYDVWLGNVRGNEYGSNHTTFSPNSSEFWNFSLDEMAMFDLPAMIDFILNTTQFSQTMYVSHSMGNTIAFALLSSMPAYNLKVKVFIALAPVVLIGSMISPLRLLAASSMPGGSIYKSMDYGKFNLKDKVAAILASGLCDSLPLSLLFCTTAVFLVNGPNYVQLDQNRLKYFLRYYPTTSSMRTLEHFNQMVESKKFTRFDFGKDENIVKYNQTTPPEYNISKITVPVAIFWSNNDFLAPPQDVAEILPKLTNLVFSHEVGDCAFSHQDFIWAKDAKSLVYDYVVDIMKNFTTYVNRNN